MSRVAQPPPSVLYSVTWFCNCSRRVVTADCWAVNSERCASSRSSALDLLDAQRSLFTAQQLAVNVRLLQLQNQVTLYRTLGGGWATREQG